MPYLQQYDEIYRNALSMAYLTETAIFAALQMTADEQYMQRCIELARKGAGSVAPNPMVGAVLVHDGNIIGEGWHQQYGEAHAEVNCINQAIENGHAEKLKHATIYVSLEPCAHFGKTPPCSDLIIKHHIPKAVIGCRDPFKEVDGKGIEKLKAAGVEVIVDVLKDECMELNRRFFTFHTKKRPYIILKWAQTKNGMIASATDERLFISNEFTNRLVHQWRTEEAAILVGKNTAALDDPQLTNRYWPGKQPLRLVLDKELELPASLKLFNADAPTIIFNTKHHSDEGQPRYYQVTNDVSMVQQMINALYQLNIQSVIVEGGAQLLQSFIDEELWDEASVITNQHLVVAEGLAAPQLINALDKAEEVTGADRINYYQHSL